MLIYSIIFILLLFGVFHFDYKKNTFLRNFYYFFVFIVCTLMMGLRYKVGGDSLTYEYIYKYLPNINNFFQYTFSDHNENNFQPSYLLFVALCKIIDKGYYFYQFIHAIIFNVVFFMFIKKYSKQPFTAIFIAYIFIVYFYFGYEIQREMFSICCFLLSYKYFIKNKWIPYYLFCIIAFSFHISAVFLFFLPFAKLLKLTKNLIIFSLIASIPILIGRVIFIDFIKILLVTESMQKKGEGYSEIEFSILGTIFFYFVRVIVFIPFLFYYAKNKVEENLYDWMLILILWISILSQVMIGFDRLNNYLYIPLIVFISNFLYEKSFKFKSYFLKKTVILSCFLFLFSIIWIKFFTANIDNKYFFYKVYFPYESVLDKKNTKEREMYLIKMWRKS
ncbi:EpsG family protein [Chryseobacterium sp. YIM B08800]|uniref:EpsG family protein n=1 Tax=Chryseobacterium sp. YIM B08800 TaxID=2984136 RepID=UPI00223FAAA6|nr:EpsG family protein [Chryseobacterium sp. YIM B08800]